MDRQVSAMGYALQLNAQRGSDAKTDVAEIVADAKTIDDFLAGKEPEVEGA